MSTATDDATIGIAMYAVAQHMLDHQLPAPVTIDQPRLILGERAVIVIVNSEDSTPWLDSMVVDEERVAGPSEVMAGREHVTYDGRIPSAVGDVAVQVRTMRTTVPLRLVGSAS